MKKIISKTAAGLLAAGMVLSSLMPVFAAQYLPAEPGTYTWDNNSPVSLDHLEEGKYYAIEEYGFRIGSFKFWVVEDAEVFRILEIHKYEFDSASEDYVKRVKVMNVSTGKVSTLDGMFCNFYEAK